MSNPALPEDVEFDNPSIGGTWIEGEYLRRLEREQ